MVPQEIFSKSGGHCSKSMVRKMIFGDSSRIMHHCAPIGKEDCGECYDRTAHSIQSISVQAFGVPKLVVQLMLTFLQLMRFFLRTEFGESEDWYGGMEDETFAGAGQESGAAPPSITVLSTLIVNAYKSMRNGDNLTSTYPSQMFVLASALWVDDTDLLHWVSGSGLEPEEFIEVVEWASDKCGQLC